MSSYDHLAFELLLCNYFHEETILVEVALKLDMSIFISIIPHISSEFYEKTKKILHNLSFFIASK